MVLIDQFINSFETPPERLTFDIDVWDDPTHGGVWLEGIRQPIVQR
jgi:hypothetical protein